MSSPASRVRPASAAALATAAVGLTAVAAVFVRSRHMQSAEILPVFIAFAVLLVPYLGLGQPDFLAAVRRLGRTGKGAAAVAAAIIVPSVAALPWSDPARSLTHVAILATYAALPLLLLRGAAGGGHPPRLRDFAALALYWLPMELGLFAGWWAHPGADPSFLLMKLTAIPLLVAGFAGYGRLDGIGYRWRIEGSHLATAAAALAGFLVIAIPAGLATGFVAWAPQAPDGWEWIFLVFGIGLFVALPEEILFRGILFNMLQRVTRGRHGPWPALIVASIIFGLAHLNNFPLGDWRYVALATIAGVFYGWCLLRTGSLIPGVLAHTAVDVIHRLLLTTTIRP